MSLTRLWVWALAAALLTPAAMLAQTFTASVRGVVTDATGSAIPGATVTVRSVQRGTDTVTETDAQGRYVVPNLQPGSYTIRAEAPGFSTAQRSAFTLAVQQQATVNLQLEIGEVTTVIDVEGAAPLLNTTSADLGQVIENKYILQLPLIGRNPMSLTYLTPGVVGSGGRAGEANTNFVASGSRNSTADVMLDGVSVTNVEQNSGVTQLKYTPSVDAVQEFKIQANFFSAEFGQTGGAMINMITKSGSNDYHGTAYWFHRNDTLNANNWFANRAGRERPEFTRNLFGGVIGGPIKRDKTFFFGTYERVNQEAPSQQFLTVPTMQQRGGDFSDYMTPAGAPIQIYNPFDLVANQRQPFANNVVPQTMQHPVSLNALEFFPTPNTAGAPFTNQNNWFNLGINQSFSNQVDAKLDHNFSDKDRIMVRYSTNWSEGNPPNLFGEGNPAVTWGGPSNNHVHSGVVDYTRTHGPRTVFNVRLGVMQNTFDRVPFEPFRPSQLGLPQYYDDNADFLTFPRFQPEGYGEIGTEGWLIIGRGEDVSQIMGNATHIVGAHTLKMGSEFRHIRLDYLQPGFPAGSLGFNRQITRRDRFAGSATQGNAIASMMLGWGSGSNYHIDPWSNSRSQYYGFYIQDDWKITSKLTLNLGLRYDLDIPRWERENRYSYWDLEAPAPINDQVPEFDLRGVFRFTDDNVRSPFDADTNNFAPRFGFAYALDNNTAIRGGYGIFYSLSRATVKGHLGAAFMTNSNVEWSRDGNATQYATLDDPYLDGLNLPTGRTLGDATLIGLPASPAMRENLNPYNQMWNMSIQRQMPGNSVLEVNYIANKGTRLLFAGDNSLSRLHPMFWGMGRSALNATVANPFFGVVDDPRSQLSQPQIQQHILLRDFQHFRGAASRGDGSEPPRGNSIYHALQMRYEKRFAQGLALLGHYTWSKMIDDVSHGAGNLNWLGGNTSVQDWYNLRNERALSAHDVPQRLVLSFSYELPIGTGKAIGSNWGRATNALLGGWEISGFATFQSGVPLQVNQDGGVLWDATQRPNLIGDPSTSGRIQDRLNGWFNEAAFSQPIGDTLGTAPRTLNYRSPHMRTADLAAFKKFAIDEFRWFEFRFELQNATNTPVFGFPGLNFGSTGFGVINGYGSGSGPRQIQIGTKFYF